MDTRIKEELEENPALEDLSLTNLSEPEEQYPDRDPEEDSYNGDENEGPADEFNIDDYLQEDNLNEYGSRYDQNGDDDDDRKEIPIAVQSSFFENLQAQLDLLPLSDKDFRIGQQIIGSLDDDGYLRRSITSLTDDLAFSQNVFAEDDEVEEILKVIQSFDPPGVGARSLQECLLIQLKRKENGDPIVRKAVQVVEHYLEEGKLDEAITTLDTVVKEDPLDVDAWFALGMYSIMKGMESMAITDLGGIDWYRQFCDQLKVEQLPDGSWPLAEWDRERVGSSGLLSTLWALLVLERAAPPPEIIP